MNPYVKQALFILLVVGVVKFANSKMPNNPLDQFLPS